MISKKEELSKYKASCNIHWPKDTKLLNSLNIECIDASSWEIMVKQVQAGRSDFLLAPFQSTDNMQLEAFGIVLLPIKNIKTHFDDDRIFITSKKSTVGERFSRALSRGLKKLKKDKIIEKAYVESGFYHTGVKDWKLISP